MADIEPSLFSHAGTGIVKESEFPHLRCALVIVLSGALALCALYSSASSLQVVLISVVNHLLMLA